jgi:hypothetical protein
VKIVNSENIHNSETKDSDFSPKDSDFSPKDSDFSPKDSDFSSKDSDFSPKDSNFLKNDCKCVYCMTVFSSDWYKNRHERICKHRNETRDLEIEMGIEPVIPQSNVECRFCNKSYSRSDYLSKHTGICKNRLSYHNDLLKQKIKTTASEQIANTIINNSGTINNGTINNTINVFGSPRSLEHIEVEKIIQFLRDLKKHHLPDQTYEQAGDLIVMMENYIQENKVNRNFIIPDYKSVIGYIKSNEDWDITGIDNPLNQQFKETAGILCDKRNDIETVNDKVFKNNTNCEIFQHVKQFKKKGFGYNGENERGGQKAKVIKSNFKITKLKEKKIECDF